MARPPIGPGRVFPCTRPGVLLGCGSIVVAKHREIVRAYGQFDFPELQLRLGRPSPYYIFNGVQIVEC